LGTRRQGARRASEVFARRSRLRVHSSVCVRDRDSQRSRITAPTNEAVLSALRSSLSAVRTWASLVQTPSPAQNCVAASVLQPHPMRSCRPSSVRVALRSFTHNAIRPSFYPLTAKSLWFWTTCVTCRGTTRTGFLIGSAVTAVESCPLRRVLRMPWCAQGPSSSGCITT